MRALLRLGFAVCLAVVGCSNATDDSEGTPSTGGPSGAPAPAGQASLDAGDAATTVSAADASVDRSSLAFQQVCTALEQQVERSLPDLGADLACSTDDDCVFVDNYLEPCSAGCGLITNSAGASLYEAALAASVTEPACVQFLGMGCVAGGLPCYMSSNAAQCVAGSCEAVLPGSPR